MRSGGRTVGGGGVLQHLHRARAGAGGDQCAAGGARVPVYPRGDALDAAHSSTQADDGQSAAAGAPRPADCPASTAQRGAAAACGNLQDSGCRRAQGGRRFPSNGQRKRMNEAKEARSKLVIAIDGPAGGGKSPIASRLAQSLGYVNLESGAMYRALGLKAIEAGFAFTRAVTHAVSDGGALLPLAHRSTIVLEPTAEGNRVLLDGRDVSVRIRERDVTDAASRVS